MWRAMIPVQIARFRTCGNGGPTQLAFFLFMPTCQYSLQKIFPLNINEKCIGYIFKIFLNKILIFIIIKNFMLVDYELIIPH